MKQLNRRFTYFWLLIMLAALVGLTLLALPVRAGSTLPPRGTPAPVPTEDKDQKTATIELVVPADWTLAWAVVEWQDGVGGWHEVEGWRGWLPENSRWWVTAKDFGTGPFRWVVTAGPEGPVLGVSESFYLPGAANEWLRVTAVPEVP